MQQEFRLSGRAGAVGVWAAICALALMAISCGKATPAMNHTGTILFLGDSLTDGHDLYRSEAYPALIATRLRAAGVPLRVVNAGVSGDTTHDGLRRLDRLLESRVDFLFVALGINDVFRGVPLPQMRENIQAVMDRTRAAWPDAKIVLAGIRMRSSWETGFSRALDDLYATLARDNGVALMPDLLEGVAERPALNMPDGLHPNAEGHAMMAENVWRVLEPVLR